ncbi:hypothetical protein HC031_15705 [Planosporangium thailandense]|uniref:SMODS-associating 2TM beta-strand rich effector domain-containing protein n=1 Tax=Planosporangium thailandense TaxID=765197 RepID=A0ABX0XYK8_9ACTN|nr:hypothetical protein [Planosporangium thailandense]NJC71146.1 hypothetical protein [Planosporangium thailandense]
MLSNDSTASAEYGQQKVIQRSRLFVVLPAAALVVLAVGLVWEIVRTNMDGSVVHRWPWGFSLLPIDTAATLVTAVGGLMLARAQYARTQRPSLGFSVDAKGANPEDAVGAEWWQLHIFNGGPGLGVVSLVEYRAQFRDGGRGHEGRGSWCSLSDVRTVLRDHGLEDQRDYYLVWLGKGAPLTPVQRARDGCLLATFNRRALGALAVFDIRLRVRDSVGDEHERVLQLVHHLPNAVAEALGKQRQRTGDDGSRRS